MDKYTDEQLKFINYTGNESIILSATAGSGKEQPLFCKILTPNGWTTMGEIKINDKVLTPNGEISSVIGVYPQGLKEVFKITFSDGSFTYAGREHLWKVQTKNEWDDKSDNFSILTTDKIKENISTYESDKIECGLYYIPLTNIEYPEKPLPMDAHLLGRFFAYDDSNQIEHILVYGLKEYLISSKKQRYDILGGLLTTNGYIENGGIYLNLNGKQLVDDVIELVNSLGGVVYVKQPDKYVMSIFLPEELNRDMFSLLGNKNGLIGESKTHTPYRAISKIEYHDNLECQCIEIDHPDHLYVTDNHIVTHNTHSTVGRLNKMIEDGVDPSRIIFFSFTNDAVNELRSRIKHNVKITTIHSFTSSLLGKMGLFKPIVTFYEFTNWYKEKYKPHVKDPLKIKQQYATNVDRFYEEGAQISSTFSAYKLQNTDGLKVPKPPFYDEYAAFIKETKSRDFSDMLIDTERYSKNPAYKHYFEGLYDYIFVDEYQDTSTLQMKILLAIKAKQYHLIGDKNQCILRDQDVLTDNGYKKIQDLAIGDLVLTALGSNRTGYKKVLDIKSNKLSGGLIELKTKGGRRITTTTNHTHFAQFSFNNENKYLVYLTYKHNYGYRIGKTEIYPKRNPSNDSDRFGFKFRLNQEHGDKIWILDSFNTLNDALIFEQKYSLLYGIPTACFVAKSKQDQTYIDTASGATRLLGDINYSILQPHFVPKPRKVGFTNITINLCSDGRGTNPIHTLEVNGYSENIKEYFETNGYICTDNGRGSGWRIRKQSSNLKDLMGAVSLISDSVNLVLKAKFTNKTFLQLPAAQVVPGMSVMVFKNGEIMLDQVVERKYIYTYFDDVFDVDVEGSHNLIVNDIFTHNSIYGFSGANCEAIENLLTSNHKTIEMTLTKNFRSHKRIVENSNKYSDLQAIPFHENDGYIHNKLINEDMLYEMMEDGKPLAILARTNNVIKEIEKHCLKEKIKMRYFNYITEQDIKNIKDGKINPSLKKKLEAVAPYHKNTLGLIDFIENNKDSDVFVTSIHKSKGREFPRCVIVNSVDPELLNEEDFDDVGKFTFIGDDGDIDIEARNIHYVAVTRPKEELYFLIYEF